MKNRFASLLLALALGSFAATAARGADAKPVLKPDADGFIRDWLMLAPIALDQENAGSDLIVKEQVPKEADLKPKEGDKFKVKDKEIAWKPVQSKKEYFFDFNEILGSQHENVAGYMVAYVVCEKELTDLTMLLGSNDQCRVYLNGKEVFKFTETRTLEKDSDKAAKLTLTKGVNVIVFKVINENNNWQGCLRFTDSKGKAVTDFTVKLAP